MSGFYSEKIFTNELFDVFKQDAAIVVYLKKENNLIISSWINGGYQENLKYIVNQTLDGTDYDEMVSMDYSTFQTRCMEKINLNPNESAGMATSACMDNYAISVCEYKDLKVTSIVTAGADNNGIKVGDPASFYEHNNEYNLDVGTINIITIIDANLEPGTLITASITATEAKTSVLQDLKLESQFSTHIATGTGTDGICVISNKSSDNHIENAGKHSKLGEIIAKSVQEATRKALYLQTEMCISYQKSVLNRLSRFNIDFDTFYNKTEGITKTDYAMKFNNFNSNTENIAYISGIIDLIDETQTNLLEICDVAHPIKNIIKLFLDVEYDVEFNSIDDVLNYLIDAINTHLLK